MRSRRSVDSERTRRRIHGAKITPSTDHRHQHREQHVARRAERARGLEEDEPGGDHQRHAEARAGGDRRALAHHLVGLGLGSSAAASAGASSAVRLAPQQRPAGRHQDQRPHQRVGEPDAQLADRQQQAQTGAARPRWPPPPTRAWAPRRAAAPDGRRSRRRASPPTRARRGRGRLRRPHGGHNATPDHERVDAEAVGDPGANSAQHPVGWVASGLIAAWPALIRSGSCPRQARVRSITPSAASSSGPKAPKPISIVSRRSSRNTVPNAISAIPDTREGGRAYASPPAQARCRPVVLVEGPSPCSKSDEWPVAHGHLAEPDVRVQHQALAAGPGVATVLEVHVHAVALSAEHVNVAGSDVGRGGHAHVARDEHQRLAHAHPHLEGGVAGGDRRVSQVHDQLADAQLVTVAQIARRRRAVLALADAAARSRSAADTRPTPSASAVAGSAIQRTVA